MNSENNLPANKNINQVPQNKHEGEYHVVLPCAVKDFSNFIAGLLGKPQEIKGEIEGVFQISYKEISNICHLITQRVTNQNNASLLHLGITVHYNDGNSISHHKVADFEAYHPTTKCFPVGVSIDFTYLIKFQNKETPEKQEINVSIEADAEHGHMRLKRWFRSGIFTFRIFHTERSWASDISGLLKGHADTIIKKPSSFVKFIINNDTEIITSLCVLIFFIVVAMWCQSTITVLDNPKSFFKIYSEASISKYMVISVTVFTGLGSFLFLIRDFFQNHISLMQISTIVFTDSDRENQVKYNKKHTRNWLIHIAGWTMSVISGIVATYIYSNGG